MARDCRGRMELEATEEVIRFFHAEPLRSVVPESEYAVAEAKTWNRNGCVVRSGRRCPICGDSASVLRVEKMSAITRSAASMLSPAMYSQISSILYGFRQRPGSIQVARRTASICLSKATIWFQLAGVGDATAKSRKHSTKR